MSETWDVTVTCSQCDDAVTGRLVLFRGHLSPTWALELVGDARGDFTALTAELSEDRPLPRFVSPGAATELDRAGRYRARYRFECSHCGDVVPAREDKLSACAEKLAGHGESHVPMTALRRMLNLV